MVVCASAKQCTNGVSEEQEEELEYEMEVCNITKDIMLRICTVVPPPIEYLTKLHGKEEEISGRRVWSGSLLLSLFFCSHDSFLYPRRDGSNQSRILELGSGTGILGMTLSTLSSSPVAVCMTDGDTEAVNLLHQNLQHNHMDRRKCDATYLLWGGNNGADSPIVFEQWCKQKWPSLFADEVVTFDTIVAGDVLYKPKLIPQLFATVQRYLSRSNGMFFLCHIPRNNVYHSHVLDGAHRAGLKILSQWGDILSTAVDTTLLPEDCMVDKADEQKAIIYQIVHDTIS
jgi:predicted nicotinamide N-methyase